MQAQYAFHNISHKSYVTVKYFTKMARYETVKLDHRLSHNLYLTFTLMFCSTASDCVIFLYLGLNLVRLDHVWHTGFTVAAVILCLVVRFIGKSLYKVYIKLFFYMYVNHIFYFHTFSVTYGLAFLINRSRMRAITSREMFIMVSSN